MSSFHTSSCTGLLTLAVVVFAVLQSATVATQGVMATSNPVASALCSSGCQEQMTLTDFNTCDCVFYNITAMSCIEGCQMVVCVCSSLGKRYIFCNLFCKIVWSNILRQYECICTQQWGRLLIDL